MVFHHLPPPPPQEPLPPVSPPPPPPPPPPRAFSTSFPLRWALGNRNRDAAKSPRRLGRLGKLPLPRTGGVDPVLRLGSSPLNPDSSNPFLKMDDPNHDNGFDSSPPPKEKNLVEVVEGLEKKTEDKGTHNLLVRLPMKKRNLSALFAEPESQAEPEAEPVAEDKPEPEAEAEEGEVFEYHNEIIHKTWNLRPRRVLEKKSSAVRGRNNGGGGVWLGNVASRTRTRLRQQKEKGGNKSGGLKGFKDSAGKKKEKEGVVLKKGMLSLTLKKKEIEEDFLKMTGSKPPKKPINKRPKAVQKQLDTIMLFGLSDDNAGVDIIFPGLLLTRVSPESYQVPDPPLKG
ncbi:hypothetical protein PIB30_084213 [Stylosanthes scabra]|uniref:Uncharacterized protein n=1 Tax=Stylosanthes scabra TaxID=79078 RepID=A0ABU6QUW4_9FABA|nr:hypothetical protein [Stylosanthes scabra]